MGQVIDLDIADEPIDVNVVNQLDLSTIEALLTQIKNSSAAIDANTDLVETKLDSVISELQTNGTTNHADLLNVITELQSIDSNTDGLETQLASVIANTSTNATEATLTALLTAFNTEDFASEATLLAIKAKTDLLTFTGDKLRTTGEDAGGVGGGSISEKLLQVDAVGSTTYLGYADAGSLTSGVVWAVKKIVETGGDVVITWADGDTSFDNVWDDRLTLTYA